MNGNLFRKSSIDKVSSPEQLNEYIRISTPGVWLLLAAIIVFITGGIVWGIFGSIETKTAATAVCESGNIHLYVNAEGNDIPKEDMTVIIDDKTMSVKKVYDYPIQIADDANDYLLFVSGLKKGGFCYVAETECRDLADGIYKAEIITKSVSPISYVLR